VRFTRLELRDFRNHERSELDLGPGVTVIVGRNGEGKTNLLEAAAFAATLTSFRGAATEALVRRGADSAVVRADLADDDRRALVELELRAGRRVRGQLNRQPLRRRRDLLGTVRVTLFAPDDLVLVKGGPAERRSFLDDLVVDLRPADDDLRRQVDRVLRQRNTLLRQMGSRGGGEALATLDVWDQQLAELGSRLAERREQLTERLVPALARRYEALARPAGAEVGVRYERSWAGDLGDALAAARPEDLRRGVSTVGPHRDDALVVLDGEPARTHGSQGEQRSLTLALRLAGHDVVAAATGSVPVVLLDDVYSELDEGRQEALTEQLPATQTLLTTTAPIAGGPRPEQVVRVVGGRVEEAAA
jgi:DNA replication and repair protein RecF